MFKSILLFLIFAYVKSLPLPQIDENGLKLLSAEETGYYQFPFFWFGRPVSGDDYYDETNNGPSFTNRRTSTVSYINVGAGWGR